MEPWSEGTVPFFFTSNAALAHHYSRVLLGWLRDLDEAGKLNRAQPVPIIEVGCGTGRFTFHLLRALEELSEALGPRFIRWSYTATDISAKRLRLIEKRREFAPHFQAKRLRTARYDMLAGNALPGRAPSNPAAVICNYVLDSLPCDCFRSQGSRLYETRIAVQGDDPKDLSGLSWRFSHHPAKIPYYRDRVLDGILEGCRSGDKSRTVLFPCGAMRGLRNLRSLALGPLLVLAADKTLPGAGADMPQIERHGKSHFSLPVDFDLLGEYARAEGGEMLVSGHGREVICFAAFLLGGAGGVYRETPLAFQEQFDRLSPTAALYLSARLEEQAPALTIHDYLAYLRLVHWDPHQWMSLFPLFIRQAASPPAELRAELVEALDRMAERWYAPGGGTVDLPFLIGSAYLEIGEAEKARAQFGLSIEEYGRKPPAVFQLGRAEFRAGDSAKAVALVREALEADPNLGTFLQHLGLMPGGEEEARRLGDQMDWEAGLRRLGHVG